MGKHKQTCYESDLVFIGNGDYIERIKQGMPTQHLTKEEKKLPVITPWDARDVINKMMVNYKKSWGDHEIELLRKFLRTNRNSQHRTSVRTMSKILGRTYYSVESKIKKERIKERERMAMIHAQ
jgi:hypothetical protein